MDLDDVTSQMIKNKTTNNSKKVGGKKKINTPLPEVQPKKEKQNQTPESKQLTTPQTDLTVDDIFKVIDLYFKQKNIMYTHLYNSFDKFFDEDIRSLLKNSSNIFFEKITKDKVYRYKFVYTDVAIKPPILDSEYDIMFPSQARTRNMTYAAKLVATITQIQEVIDITTDVVTSRVIGTPEHEYPIANIPLMVRSKYCSLNLKRGYDKSECEYDPGGYFIVNGSEKVVMALERMIDNKPLVFIKKDSSSLTYIVQVNSKNYMTDQMQIVTVRIKKDNSIIIKVPIISELPVFIVMRALGIETDKDIINYIVYDKNDIDMLNIMRMALEASKPDDSDKKILTQEEALNYLINKMRVIKKYNETDKDIRAYEKKMHLKALLRDSFLPHVEGTLIHKAYYLGYMINRLLQCYLGRIPVDDRDAFPNKRIDLPGTLMYELFKQFYKKMLNECSKFFRKRNTDDEHPINIINQIKPNIIEQGLKTALLTGAWGKRKGVAQMLQRLSYLQTLSSLRRINSPTVDASTNKLTSPRHLHGTGMGFLCVTGDTEILLSDGVTVKKIKDMTNNDTVLTVNRNDLSVEVSKIHSFFSKMPDKLLKITTISGREIKCTPDHPLLIKTGVGKYEMIEAGKLKEGQCVIVKHCQYLEGKNVCESLELGLLDKDSSQGRLEIEDGKREFVSIAIGKIEEISVERVYDFTTVSENHSFIGNGVCLSNCFIETSEGHKVGLVKNLSLIGNVTVMMISQIQVIKTILKDKVKNIEDVPTDQIYKYTKVFFNGEWLGLTDTPRELYLEMKQLKYKGEIDIHTSVIHEIKSEIESKELKVYCDGGRLFRPVFRSVNNKILLNKTHVDLISIDDKGPTLITNWNELMIKHPGIIEYIDVDEQFNAMIAMYPSDVSKMYAKMNNSIELVEKQFKKTEQKHIIVNRYDDFAFIRYTHCEIHPSLLIGVVVSNIPFLNCNQGPRNIYQYSQARQAMGVFASNYRDRLDISYILYNPQRPLVTTRAIKYINTDKLPAGENAVVAIMCYSGYKIVLMS